MLRGTAYVGTVIHRRPREEGAGRSRTWGMATPSLAGWRGWGGKAKAPPVPLPFVATADDVFDGEN